VLADPDRFVWGFTVMKWTDGKHHGYYARWPKKLGFNAWMTDCEIAHAVADKPEGPFRTTGTVIESRHAEGWDVVNAHNPAVCVAEGKVCLYYISNLAWFSSKDSKAWAPAAQPVFMKKRRWPARLRAPHARRQSKSGFAAIKPWAPLLRAGAVGVAVTGPADVLPQAAVGELAVDLPQLTGAAVAHDGVIFAVAHHGAALVLDVSADGLVAVHATGEGSEAEGKNAAGGDTAP
jgi:hypothetical protein